MTDFHLLTAPTIPNATWSCTWLGGPDSGGTVSVGPGEHVIGRATHAGIRCDDPSLEPHHALLTIDSDGSVRISQLCGRVPIRVDGEPGDDAAIAGAVSLEIGRSRLAITPADPDSSAGDNAPARRTTIVRPARQLPYWDRPVPIPPVPTGSHRDLPGGLVMGLVGLVVATLIAVFMHQPMFLLLGAVGSLATIGTWVGARVRARRTGRAVRSRDARAHRDFELALDSYVTDQRDHLIATTTSLVTAARLIEADSPSLWSRRREHADAFVVSLGTGDLDWVPVPADPPVRPRTSATALQVPALQTSVSRHVLADVPITVDLGPGERLALAGPRVDAYAVVRSILLQLATNCGPADLRVVIVTNSQNDWEALQALPHLQGPDAALIVADTDLAAALATLDHASRPHIIVVVDDAALLTARTGPVRRALADETLALLVVVEPSLPIPHLCTAQLHLSGTVGAPTARWFADVTTQPLPQHVRIAGLGAAAARRLAGVLEPAVDPEDPLRGASAIPRQVELTELLTLARREAPVASSIAAGWRAGGCDPAPCTPLGIAADGVVDLDLVRDGPHGLLAGTTGSGKSELLRSLVIGLAVANSPDHLTFVLVDYKGGATFDGCAALPHVVGVVTDLDDHLADRALRSLHAELRHREAVLRSHGAADLTSLRTMAPTVRMPRLVVVIDEFAALVGEQPEFLHALVGVAQRGRSLGVHLLLATQRPAGVISDEIRANTNLRIALRLHDAADATDVIGDAGPAAIGRNSAGRAMMRLGPNELVTFQTACCTVPAVTDEDSATDLQRLVAAIREAARLSGIEAPRPPWLPPLPLSLMADSTWDRAQIGLADDPDGQCRRAQRLDPAAGQLLIAGAAAMGATSALISVAQVMAEHRHLYVIDASNGDERLAALDELPTCAASVRLHERERLARLLHRLDTAGRAHAAGVDDGQPPVALLIDGIDRLRHELDDPATAEQFDMLERIVGGGGGRVFVAATTRRLAALPLAMLAAFQQRWVLHLTDPHDAAAVGLSANAAVAAVPGRCIDAASGLEMQLARPRDCPHEPASLLPAAAPIRCLPAVLDAELLAPACVVDEVTALSIGLAFTSGTTLALGVPDGEHALVLGPSRSGKTTTLARLAVAWREAHPCGRVRIVQPRRHGSPMARHLASRGDVVDGLGAAMADLAIDTPTLLLIDDAELVDDAGGSFAAALATRRSGLMVIAAAKPDALRQTYGHWTAVIRRSRLGLVAAAGTELDGDLLGVLLPRRLPVAPRPGLMWLVDNGTTTLGQIGLDAPAIQTPADQAMSVG